jgi:hypothetical protein
MKRGKAKTIQFVMVNRIEFMQYQKQRKVMSLHFMVYWSFYHFTILQRMMREYKDITVELNPLKAVPII